MPKVRKKEFLQKIMRAEDRLVDVDYLVYQNDHVPAAFKQIIEACKGMLAHFKGIYPVDELETLSKETLSLLENKKLPLKEIQALDRKLRQFLIKNDYGSAVIAIAESVDAGDMLGFANDKELNWARHELQRYMSYIQGFSSFAQDAACSVVDHHYR